MPLVALKCPNCSGEVQFEEDMKSGFCIHCGSKIINQRALNGSISIDRSSDIINHLKIAKEASRVHDWENLAKLIDSILLMDADCHDAWCMKALLCYRNETMFEDIMLEIGRKGTESYGIFSREDIKKCWGEYELRFKWVPGPNIYPHVKAFVTVDGKESFSVGKDAEGICGVNAGEHNISVCLATVWEGKEAVSYDHTPVSRSFTVSKDHLFQITTVRVGFWETRSEIRVTQIS
jgi:hypothetical protein